MYGKDEAKLLKKEFWTAFGMVMKPHLSADGLKINWINYKTGVKDILFKTDANKKLVSISIQLHHADDGIRELYWEQLGEFKSLFHSIVEEEWIWEDTIYDDYGKPYSSVHTFNEGNIFNQDQWQDMFEFLKPRLLKLDKFWSDAKDIFITL